MKSVAFVFVLTWIDTYAQRNDIRDDNLEISNRLIAENRVAGKMDSVYLKNMGASRMVMDSLSFVMAKAIPPSQFTTGCQPGA